MPASAKQPRENAHGKTHRHTHTHKYRYNRRSGRSAGGSRSGAGSRKRGEQIGKCANAAKRLKLEGTKDS
eukprot:6186010-Pleurochrysis_carterae.AAC.2